jgi:hypothetical protein
MADAESAAPSSLTINYLKSFEFREIACDGAVGGPTPQGKLWLAFYTERFPLPRIVRHKLKRAETEGTMMFDTDAPAEPVEAREGIIRNVEFGLYMSIDTAELLHDWLGRNIAALRGRERK